MEIITSHVVFKTFNPATVDFDFIAVPVENARQYYLDNQTSEAESVIWFYSAESNAPEHWAAPYNPFFKSFAKQLSKWNEKAKVWELAKVGAGAGGFGECVLPKVA